MDVQTTCECGDEQTINTCWSSPSFHNHVPMKTCKTSTPEPDPAPSIGREFKLTREEKGFVCFELLPCHFVPHTKSSLCSAFSGEFQEHALSNLVSFQYIFRHFFSHNFLCEKVVNFVLVFSCHEWVTMFTECICPFPSILHHSRELPAYDVMVLCSVVVVVMSYSAANACSNLDSSSAMGKNLSRAFLFLVITTIPPITFSVLFSWLIPCSGAI